MCRIYIKCAHIHGSSSEELSRENSHPPNPGAVPDRVGTKVVGTGSAPRRASAGEAQAQHGCTAPRTRGRNAGLRAQLP